ncbi:MAG: rRNA pseudouridine synthase [Clostridiales bacterium]|nr:rRNA pseudouridine synthase [Clostridiales bacterium]
MERIDKVIASQLNITRSEVKKLIKENQVILNSELVRVSDKKINPQADEIIVKGQILNFKKFVYIMMNKPKGVISSTDGRKTAEKTVLDILPDEMKRKNLFPAGRLDKDTTGFMLITDDGLFAHNILSPKNHISKTYIAVLDKPFDSIVISEFSNGVTLKNEICMPAVLEPVCENFKIGKVIINQGMYHQIKRMFSKFGITVLDLKRVAMGNLFLDEALDCGKCRFLSQKEVNMIKNS